MNRARLNLLVDGLAFCCAVLLAATGFVLEAVLPAGSGRLEGAGTGWGAMERPVTLLWGWTRHDWGEIHFTLALTLLGVLCLHFMLHWRAIVCMVKGQQPRTSRVRILISLLGLLALLAVATAPFLSKTATITRGELRQHQSTQERTLK
jgi:hypothetical protein